METNIVVILSDMQECSHFIFSGVYVCAGLLLALCLACARRIV